MKFPKMTNRHSHFDFGMMIFCALCLLLFVYLSPWNSQDGPNHRQVASTLVRLSELSAEPSLESKIYQSNLSLLQTNQLFPALYQSVSKLLSIEAYEKAFVSFFLIAFIISYHFFLKAYAPENLVFWPLVLPLCFNPLIVRGLYNFLACLPLTLLGLILLKKGKSPGRILVYGMVTWMAFTAHPFSLLVLLTVLFLRIFAEAREDQKALLPFLLITLLFFGLGFFPQLLNSIQNEKALPLKFSPPWETLAGLFIWNVSGFFRISFLIFAPFFLFLLRLAFRSLKEVPWREKKYWLSFLLLLFVFPAEASQGSFLNHRFLIFVWLFLPLGLQASESSHQRVFWIGLMTFLACLSSTSYAMHNIEKSFKEARQVLNSLPTSSRLYPINFDPTLGAINMHPLLHQWALYADSKVILSPYLFAYSNLMPLARKQPASSTYFPSDAEDFPQEVLQEKTYSRLLQKADFYDYCYLHEAPDEFIQILQKHPSLEKIAEAGKSSLWRHRNPKAFEPNPYEF